MRFDNPGYHTTTDLALPQRDTRLEQASRGCEQQEFVAPELRLRANIRPSTLAPISLHRQLLEMLRLSPSRSRQSSVRWLDMDYPLQPRPRLAGAQVRRPILSSSSKSA